jgi:hypothetical protein
MNPSTIVWIHGDCLSPYNPALLAYPGAAAVFVWDEALLAEWRISLKRIVFIYECLLELHVTIRRGDVAEEVARFAARHHAASVATTRSPSPRFAGICDRLQVGGLAVEAFEVEPFLAYGGRLDLTRFSRYWRTARRYVLK